MDEKTLKKILSQDHAPAIDENARKRALNMAMSEFKTAQSEKNQKTSQGISFLSRLMGKTNNERGVHTMERKTKKRFMYGGMATAMAVIFVGGLSLTQLQETIDRHEAISSVPQGATITGTPGDVEDLTPAYVEAVEQQNEADLERAIRKGESAIPVPIETPETRLEVPQAEKQSAEPLHRWRRLQEETPESQAIAKTLKPVTPSVGKNKKADSNVAADAVAAPSEKGGEDPLARWRRLQDERVERQMRTQETELEPANAGAMPSAAPPPPVALNYGGLKEAVESNKSAPVVQDKEMDKFDNLFGFDDGEGLDYEKTRDAFDEFTPNPFKQVSAEPVSTFSSDVDTASYSFVRKTINNGRLPNPAAVRVEEMVNYFDYDYAVPSTRAEPFKPTVTITDSPWAKGRKLMHIGVKGYDVAKNELRSNVVFLLDVSGSMNQRDKLPLVKSSMKMLLDSLHPDDTVSIVTYAGSTGIVLEPTKASNRNTIIRAMNNLRAGGGTAGAAGIELAYNMAERNFDKRAVNRVILATDGDFNVGITDRNELKRYIERKRDKGIFLSVLGFGQGNYNDQLMQTLAQNGNGIAAYIDNLNEAQKVLVQQATSSLFPIAKDVKFQVEFNPSTVAEYRLIGYETRALKREDFNNDKIDAGDIGAGHSVTAIYEFVPVGSDARTVDELRYGQSKKAAPVKPVMDDNGEYAFLKIRYKLPMENTSKLITTPIATNQWGAMQPIKCGPTQDCVQSVSNDTRFATAVAAFGQILKGGEHTGTFDYDDVIELAQSGRGNDQYGYRAEFIKMVRLAKSLSR